MRIPKGYWYSRTVYFWKCQKCGLTFDRHTKGEPKTCPQCKDRGCKTFEYKEVWERDPHNPETIIVVRLN